MIADFCETYKSEMKPILNISKIEDMIKKLKESKSSKIIKTVNWSQKVF
jgi:hypothetical protein